MHIYVGTIAWRSLEAPHVQCVLRLLREPNVIYDVKWGDALVDRARAIISTRFLRETTADVLVQIDSDILFEPKDVLQIAEQAMTHDIVAGVYVTRNKDRCIPASHFVAEQPMVFGDDPTPQEAKWVASGFLATHRRVYERLAKDIPLCHANEAWAFHPFYTPFPIQDMEQGYIYLSEDWAFCERAKQAGFGVYLNPAVRLQHLGLRPYDLSDLVKEEISPEGMRVTRTLGPGSRYLVEMPTPVTV